jgi:hypothetical protein
MPIRLVIVFKVGDKFPRPHGKEWENFVEATQPVQFDPAESEMFAEFEHNGVEMMVYIEYKEIVELNAATSKGAVLQMAMSFRVLLAHTPHMLVGVASGPSEGARRCGSSLGRHVPRARAFSGPFRMVVHFCSFFFQGCNRGTVSVRVSFRFTAARRMQAGPPPARRRPAAARRAARGRARGPPARGRAMPLSLKWPHRWVSWRGGSMHDAWGCRR